METTDIERTAPASEETATETCPRDGQRLHLGTAGTIRFWTCTKCHGLWLEKNCVGAALHGTGEDWKLPIDLEEKELRCRCSSTMESQERFGFEMMTCPDCGAVWMDGGELSYLRELLAFAEDLEFSTHNPMARSVFRQRALRTLRRRSSRGRFGRLRLAWRLMLRYVLD